MSLSYRLENNLSRGQTDNGRWTHEEFAVIRSPGTVSDILQYVCSIYYGLPEEMV